MTKSLTRRQFLASAGFGISGLMLASCVAADMAQPPGDEAVAPASAEPVTLEVLWVSQPALLEYFDGYQTEQFGPANDGATTEFIVAPAGEFPQKLMTGVAAGAPPDIVRSNYVQTHAQLALNGILLSLDDLIERDNFQDHLDTFLARSVDAYAFAIKRISIPLMGHPSSYILFYNRTAFTEQGITLDNPDWTWDEYVEATTSMTDAESGVFGSWIRANFEGWMVGLRSMGADIVDETGTKSMVATDEARRWWEHVYHMIVEQKAAPLPTDVTDWKPPFAASQIMSANDNGYRESFMREMVEDFEFDVWTLPNESDQPRGMFMSSCAAITAASSHVDLAWEWNRGLVTVAEGIKRTQVAQVPPLPIEDAILAPEAMVSPQYEFYARQWVADPPKPVTIPPNGRIAEVFSALQSGFDGAWLEDEPLDSVLEAVDREIQGILEKDPA